MVDGPVYIVVGVIAAKQGDDINQSVELSLWVALDYGFEFSKQGLNGIGADQKWQLSNGESPLNEDVFFEPG